MTSTSNAQTRSRIFKAIVTPASVSTRTGKNGKYTYLAGATVETSKGSKTMTAMAFGKSHQEVASKLRKGRPVELAVRFDGATLRIVGLPREKAEPEAAAAAA